MDKKKSWLVVALLGATVSAHAGVLIDSGVSLGGEAQNALAADWMTWALSFPMSNSPMFDSDGSRAHLGNLPSVFFLGGSFGGDAVRTFSVPLGKPIFFPVANNLSFQTCPGGADCVLPDTDSSIRQDAKNYVDSKLLFMSATVDGVSLNAELLNHRQASPPGLTVSSVLLPELGFCWPNTDCASSPTYTNGIAATDGYWLMLNPLSPGNHTISFSAAFTDGTSLNITDNISAVPLPASVVLFLSGLASVGVARRQRSLTERSRGIG